MRRAVLMLALASCTRGPFHSAQKLGGVTIDAATLNRGHANYEVYCRSCHGENGDGNGWSAANATPPPRDFTQGLFKFGGVPVPGLPPDSELIRIVKNGLHGTPMLGWKLDDAELLPILHYIKTFSPRWQTETAAAPIEISPDPFGEARASEAIALGARVYHVKARCSACHASFVTNQELRALYVASGATTAPLPLSRASYEAKPRQTEYCRRWNGSTNSNVERVCAEFVAVVPPDFSRDPLRSVRPETTVREQRRDLYRVIASGIAGAAMPTWKGSLSEDELWSLAYYVQSLTALGNRGARERSTKFYAPDNLTPTLPAGAAPTK